MLAAATAKILAWFGSCVTLIAVVVVDVLARLFVKKRVLKLKLLAVVAVVVFNLAAAFSCLLFLFS